MFNTHIRLTKFGPGFWFRFPGVGPGFYSFPKKMTSKEKLTSINQSKTCESLLGNKTKGKGTENTNEFYMNFGKSSFNSMTFFLAGYRTWD